MTKSRRQIRTGKAERGINPSNEVHDPCTATFSTKTYVTNDNYRTGTTFANRFFLLTPDYSRLSASKARSVVAM
jgi:hypothetical protein